MTLVVSPPQPVQQWGRIQPRGLPDPAYAIHQAAVTGTMTSSDIHGEEERKRAREGKMRGRVSERHKGKGVVHHCGEQELGESEVSLSVGG